MTAVNSTGSFSIMRFRHSAVILAILAALLVWGRPTWAADKSAMWATVDSLETVMAVIPEKAPSFDSTTTLEDYLAVALARSLKLRSAHSRWIADLKKSDHAGSLPDPVFTYAYFVENVETRVGPQEHRFGLRQAFPWFGTLGAKEDMAFAISQASFQRFQATRLELLYEVKAAYYDYYFLGQDLLITSENMELLKFWESVAQSKYRVGLKRHPDVIKVQVELGKLEDRLRSLQEQLEPTAARMRALLNLPDSVDIPVPQSIDVAERSLSGEAVVEAIRQNNPNLRVLDRIVESRQAGERLAGRQTMPSFSIGVDYIQTGAAELIQADASDFHLDERFGLIVSTYDSLNHLKDRQALLDCFRCVRAVCEGYFVFDLNTREGLKHWNGVNVEEDGDNLVMIRQGSYDGRSDRAHMKITAFVSQADGSYRRCEETVYNTVFDLAWVKDSLLGAGFTAIHFAPSRDLSEVLADPEQEGRVLVVAS